jgi:hypothetical protein
VDAQLAFPAGVAVDGSGNIYIADTDNLRIRMTNPDFDGDGYTPCYVYDDTVPFNWIDATDGTPLTLGLDDTANVNIGFEFEFFGNTYNTINVDSHGYSSFNFDTSTFSNACIPDSVSPNNFIAPYWDDVDPSTGGEVYYKSIGIAPNRQFIVEWFDLPISFTDTNGITFEVILNESDNSILCQYHDLDFGDSTYDYGASCTVGIENEDGSS